MIEGPSGRALQSPAQKERRKGVLVALSGGIDSAVAAMLLLEKGWFVKGLHLILPAPDGQTQSRAEKASALARTLGIEIDFLDLSDPFRKAVIEPFFASYLMGRTPNPCVLCNAEIKFPALLAQADKGAFSYIATGHYAVVQRDPNSDAMLLLRGEDRGRDQSYFLHRLGSASLERLILPLGGLSKEQVKKKALAAGFSHIPEGESREVCFLGRKDYRALIRAGDISKTSGKIVDSEGQVLGRHMGIHLYTIGQRHGLGIAHSRPLYVKGLNHGRREVVVCDREGLYRSQVAVNEWHWTGPALAKDSIRCTAQIRYRHNDEEGKLEILPGGKAFFTFDRPQWAVTPGQALVCYLGKRLVGGGWIEGSLR